VRDAGHRTGVPVTPIGRIRAEPGLTVLDDNRQPLDVRAFAGYDHFA